MKLLFAGFAAAGAAALVTFGGASRLFRQTITRQGADTQRTMRQANTVWDSYIPKIKESHSWLEKQTLEPVFIQSFDGLRLAGHLLAADRPSEKLAICFHGYTGNSVTDNATIVPFYHKLGYHVLVVDARAHGDSEGEYVGFGILDRRDCRAWTEWAVERFEGRCQIVLHGTSMGAATILMASGGPLPNAKAIVADCPFTCPWDVFSHILHTQYHLPEFPVLYAADKLCRTKAGYGFRDCSADQEVSKSKIPTLFIHGQADSFVPPYLGQRVYNACTAEKQQLLIPNAGHAESRYLATELYESAVTDFLDRYVEPTAH